MDIDERDKNLKAMIKSNLVSFGLQPEQIEAITEQILEDVIEVFNVYELSHL